MNACDYSSYALPTINFIAGETQDLVFNVYFYRNKEVFNLDGCACSFSISNFMNQTGEPILVKNTNVNPDEVIMSNNRLMITLSSSDTIELSGKYVYQIVILDEITNAIEIPKQGILYIKNNIDKQTIQNWTKSKS